MLAAILVVGLVGFGLTNPMKAPHGSPDGIPAMALLTAGLIAVVMVSALVLRWSGAVTVNDAPAQRSSPGESDQAGSVFICYARADAPSVKPICDDLEKRGQEIWVDTKEIDAGENWAGEIVRAIKSVRGVAVMCSKAAFESDHVKREVYLADRYKRRIVPVFLEDAAIPEDFEYFFAGVQWIKLKDMPQRDRGKAVAKALS